MKLVFSLPTFLALSAAGGYVANASNDSLRGASPTLDQDRSLQVSKTPITGTSQYACANHPTVQGLSVCQFGVSTASLTSNPYDGEFNRVSFQNVGSTGPGSTGTTQTGGSGNGQTGATGSGSTFNGPDASQNTPGGVDSDAPPAEGGNYDSQDTLPDNTAQMCVTNGVAATCPPGGPPSIACCTSGVTAAFFNACCPLNYSGINMGTGATDQNEFEMMMLTGTGVAESADCVVNDNGQGCQIFDVPSNQANQPVVYPTGVDGPCVELTSGQTCSTTTGTCSIKGSGAAPFPVCCPACATGTYLPGQDCQVTLPNPAACGYNVNGSGATNNVQPVRPVNQGLGGRPTGNQVVGAATAAPVRTYGSTGTGGSCTTANDCVQNHVCISKNGGICASNGSCYNDEDCNNPYNQGWSAVGCVGKAKCSGVVCQRDCMGSETMVNPNGGLPDDDTKPAKKGETLECPKSPPTDGDNCCAYIADNKIEKSCMYPASGQQCDCAGQVNNAGSSYCGVIGWNCRVVFSSSSISTSNGVATSTSF